MIVCIYNRTLEFELLLGSHVYQREIMKRYILGISIFGKHDFQVATQIQEFYYKYKQSFEWNFYIF